MAQTLAESLQLTGMPMGCLAVESIVAGRGSGGTDCGVVGSGVIDVRLLYLIGDRFQDLKEFGTVGSAVQQGSGEVSSHDKKRRSEFAGRLLGRTRSHCIRRRSGHHPPSGQIPGSHRRRHRWRGRHPLSGWRCGTDQRSHRW